MWRYAAALFVLFFQINSMAPEKNSFKIECVSCSPGTYSTDLCGIPLNRTNTSAPVCQEGHCIAFDQGWANCSFCQPGAYQNNWASTLCVLCEPGNYCGIMGSRSCNPCPQGSYCPDRGCVQPKKCERGRYCPKGSMSESYLCPRGYTCPNVGTIVPLECDAGYYCEGGLALPKECPDNSYCPPGCDNCPIPCRLLFESQKMADHCQPQPVFYVIIGLVFVFVGVIVAFVWIAASKQMKEKKENNRSVEITALIPKPDGPKYAGF